MKIKIDSRILKHFPSLMIGIVVIKGLRNDQKISATQQLLDGICAQTQKKYSKESLENELRLQAWRDAYEAFGVNPKKYPCSVEALISRVVKGGNIPTINTIVDIYNYLSLKNIMPFGGEDLDRLSGDLILTYAEGEEPFSPLGSEKIEYPTRGEVIYRDDEGVTCRRWNYRECDRTKFTKETVNAAILIENMGVLKKEEMEALLNETKQFVEKYCGGEGAIDMLSLDNPEMETGIEGIKKEVEEAKKEEENFRGNVLDLSDLNTGNAGGAEGDSATQAMGTSTEAYAVAGAGVTTGTDSQSKAPAESKNEDGEKKSESQNQQAKVEKEVEKKTDVSKKAPVLNSTWKERIQIALQKAVESIYSGAIPEVEVSYPRDAAHGDYSSNLALQIGKKLEKNPQEVAQKVKESLGKIPGIERIEIAGPGFLNFHLSNTSLNNELNRVLKKREVYGESCQGDGKTAILDYSSPNIAKPLAAHHLPTTIIGQVLNNLHKAIGYKTVGINHIGDWGTQFGKLIYAYKKWGDKEKIEKEGISGMLSLYVRFHDEAEKDSSLEDKARAEFKRLEDGDISNRQIWNWFIEITMKEIEPVYKTLGVHFDEVIGESFYEDRMGVILKMGKEKGVFKAGESGALIAEFENPAIPTCLVQKGDGATLYLTRDLATVKYRVDTWQARKIIYVVDIAQSLHFKQLFDLARRLELVTDDVSLIHVDFGRMSLPEGSMSTRKGNIIFMADVLKEAVERALEVINEKSPTLDENERRRIAQMVGIGAIKYNILSQNRTTDITFVWDKMLSFEGNSAPYLQYTTARANSILRKVSEEEDRLQPPLKGQTSLLEFTENAQEEEEDMTEIELKRLLPKYPEVLMEAAEAYKPNILTNYLFELAQKFNAFYNDSRVLGMAEKTLSRRVKLVRGALQVLTNGLKILGIEPLERM